MLGTMNLQHPMHSADMVIVGAQFDLRSADSSRALPVAPAGSTAATVPGSYTVGPPSDGATVIQTEWAAGYAQSPVATNEWMHASVPRDLGYGFLALRLAPRAWAATQPAASVRAVVGGRTLLEDGRAYAWGTAVSGANPVWVGQFLVRPPPAEGFMRNDMEPAESLVCVRADVWLEFADPAAALGVTRLAKFASPVWTAPTVSGTPGRALMVLPDVDEWQDRGECHGLADFSVWTSSPNARCAWSEEMDARSLALLGLSPTTATPRAPCGSRTHDHGGTFPGHAWDRSTHSFAANLAQFRPDNAVAVHDAAMGGGRLVIEVTRCASAGARAHKDKPYFAAEVRSAVEIAPPQVVGGAAAGGQGQQHAAGKKEKRGSITSLLGKIGVHLPHHHARSHAHDSQAPAPATATAGARNEVVWLHATLRAARASGVVSAAFTYRSADPVQEIDIVEVTGNLPRTVQLNLFEDNAVQAGGGLPRRVRCGWDATEALHSYAVGWTRHAVVWRVDGRPVFAVADHGAPAAVLPGAPRVKVPERGTHLLLNTWPSSSGENWAGKLHDREWSGVVGDEARVMHAAEYAEAGVERHNFMPASTLLEKLDWRHVAVGVLVALLSAHLFPSPNSAPRVVYPIRHPATTTTTSPTATKPPTMTTSPFYALTALDARKNEVKFSDFQGKVVLIVNVASKCGFTPQYDGLEALNKKYKDQGLQVIGFPCNQFGGQEPGTEEEIVTTCRLNYGVSFPVMAKVDVNGENEHPVYKYLKSQKSSMFLKSVKWNFEKFLVDRDGNVVNRYTSLTKPEDIAGDIEKYLAKPATSA
ncbi:Glutathione peroxidase 2 [Blastocladiella emersonii ATCC 22665]|nr:Glutathione peroxidase 2 [Blastocladiella emersonii ATCC 22665]